MLQNVKGTPKFVVGLDFGTYGSGPAYAVQFPGDPLSDSPIIHEFDEWPDQPEPYSKTRTAILYEGNKVVAWGWTAIKEHERRQEEFRIQQEEEKKKEGEEDRDLDLEEDDDYFRYHYNKIRKSTEASVVPNSKLTLVQNIKLLLFEGLPEDSDSTSSDRSSNFGSIDAPVLDSLFTYGSTPYSKIGLRKPRIPTGMGARQVIADFLQKMKQFVIKVLTDRYNNQCVHDGSSPQTFDPYQWVQWTLTVPAIWSDAQKQEMRYAAYLAGLTQTLDSKNLLIVLEPEAAAVAALRNTLPIPVMLTRLRLTPVAGQGDGDMVKGGEPVLPRMIGDFGHSTRRKKSLRQPRLDDWGEEMEEEEEEEEEEGEEEEMEEKGEEEEEMEEKEMEKEEKKEPDGKAEEEGMRAKEKKEGDEEEDGPARSHEISLDLPSDSDLPSHLDLHASSLHPPSILAAAEGSSASTEVASGEKLLKENDVLLVVDCGGGTIDVTLHQVTSGPYGERKLCEAAVGSGGPWGSATLDQRFEQWARRKVGSTIWDSWIKDSDHLAEFRHEWEYCKRKMNNEVSPPLKYEEALGQAKREIDHLISECLEPEGPKDTGEGAAEEAGSMKEGLDLETEGEGAENLSNWEKFKKGKANKMDGEKYWKIDAVGMQSVVSNNTCSELGDGVSDKSGDNNGRNKPTRISFGYDETCTSKTSNENRYFFDIPIPRSLSRLIAASKKSENIASSSAEKSPVPSFESKTDPIGSMIGFTHWRLNVVQFLHPTIIQIILIVEQVLKSGNNNRRYCNKLLMVGGFSGSRYLQKTILQFVNKCHPGIKVAVPNRPDNAVLKGAVYLGYEPLSISSRRMRRCFGVATSKEWSYIDMITSQKSGYPKKVSYDNKTFARGCFEPYVKRNELVPADGVVVHTFCPSSMSQTSISFAIYATDSESAQYIQEPGVTKITNVTINLPYDWKNYVGKPSDLEVDVAMKFGSTEISCVATEKRTYQKVSTSLKYDDSGSVRTFYRGYNKRYNPMKRDCVFKR